MRTFASVAALLLLAGCASLDEIMPSESRLDSSDPAALASGIRYADDPLNTTINADTRGVGGKWYIFGQGFQDLYFVAQQDRATHKVSVSLLFRSESTEWLFPSKANFGTPARGHDLRRVDSDVSCGSTGCHHVELVAAGLSDQDLREIVAASDALPIRIFTRVGYIDTSLFRAEMVALLDRMGALGPYLPAAVTPAAQ